MYVGLHVQYPQFLSDFKEIFSNQFRQNAQISSFIKPIQLKLRCSVRTDGRTGGRKDRYNDANSIFEIL